MRLIDADRLIMELPVGCFGAVDTIDNQPAIEPQQGEWQLSDMNTHIPKATCSLCGYTDLFNVKGYMKYCPNCGSKMTNGG